MELTLWQVYIQKEKDCIKISYRETEGTVFLKKVISDTKLVHFINEVYENEKSSRKVLTRIFFFFFTKS